MADLVDAWLHTINKALVKFQLISLYHAQK